MVVANILLFLMERNLLHMSVKRNKVKKLTGEALTNMTTPSKTPSRTAAPQYPVKTAGSEAAASTRKEANKWSEETRAKLFEQGMQVISGGSGPASAKGRS